MGQLPRPCVLSFSMLQSKIVAGTVGMFRAAGGLGVGRIWEDDDKTVTSEDLCNKVSCKERNNCYFQIIFPPITLSTKIFLDWVPQRRAWRLGLWSGSHTSYLIEEEGWFPCSPAAGSGAGALTPGRFLEGSRAWAPSHGSA